MRQSAPGAHRLWRFCVMSVSSLLFLSLIAAPTTRAQQDQIVVLAGQIAGEIALFKVKHSKLAVFVFVGPHGRATPLGRKLSEEFNRALDQPHSKFRLVDAKSVDAGFPAEQMASSAVTDPKLILSTAQDMKWDAVIGGNFSIEDDAIVLNTFVATAEDGQKISYPAFRIPMTDELRRLSAGPRIIVPSVPTTGAYATNPAGYTAPHCVSCPNAPFSDYAAQHRFQGEVFLSVVILPDGTVTDIAVKKEEEGLTASAVRTVARWKLQPALGPDGNPAPVRQTIECKFNLYSGQP